MADEEQVENDNGDSARSKLKTMVMIAVGAILIATLSVGATWFMLGRNPAADPAMAGDTPADGANAESDPGPAMYLAIQQPFIVNYTVGARTRFLQLELSLVAHDGEAIDAANTHMPVIRNNLLDVLARQDYNSLQTLEGKQALVAQLTETVQAVLQEKIGRPGIETVLFRSFVMQ